MNDREWAIKEVEQNELCSAHNDFSGDGCYYGTTFPSIQEIWLYKVYLKMKKILPNLDYFTIFLVVNMK